MKTRVQRDGGFTLVEVLVAMMIMSILAMMAWQGVDSIVQARNISQSKLEKLLRVNTVIAQFEADLNASQDSGSLPQQLPTFDGLAMRMTRRTPTGLQLVVWSLRSGIWTRWAGTPVTTAKAMEQSWSTASQLMGNEPAQIRTLTGISEWQCYFYRGAAWSNCQSSGGAGDGKESNGVSPPPAAPTPDGTSPPQSQTAPNEPIKGVRIVLTFGEGSDFAGTITREIGLGP